MVGTSENIGNYKQRTVRVTPCWSVSGIAFVTAASVVTVEMAAQSIAPQEDAFIGVFINDEKQFRQKSGQCRERENI